ncbi:MAG: hypothetical protein HDS70_03510 [Bacteroidales bacterium]|nr:hypothetical protein [Bacteroidales bacterium]
MSPLIAPEIRLNQIIDYAYTLFCNRVAGEAVHIDNEASMQLHLSNILLQIGLLNQFSADEQFYIELEKHIELVNPTSKTRRKARVDIWIELKKGGKTDCAAALELKFLNKSDTPAVTDARHSVYQDLENLEHYASQLDNLLICEIVCSDNLNFLENKGIKFSIAQSTDIQSYPGDTTYSRIELSQQYPPIHWDQYGKYNFLKISPIIR